MKLADFPEVVASLGVACGCTLMLAGRHWHVLAGMVLTFGSAAWYAAEGMYRDGRGQPRGGPEAPVDAGAQQGVASRDRPGA